MLRRSLALLAVAVVLYGPVWAFVSLSGIPLLVRALWFVALGGAFLSPWRSLLVFLAAAPLLATLPTIEHWPRVSLGELWLFALLLPAWGRLIIGRRAGGSVVGGSPVGGRTVGVAARLPVAALVLLVIATCSLIVTYYRGPVMGEGDWWSWMVEAVDFLHTDYVSLNTQRHFYASVVAWATLAEGTATLWLVLVTLEDERPRARVEQALVAMALGAVLAASAGAYQWWTGDALLPFWRLNDPYITRINATFSDVNAAGAYFSFMLVPVWTIARLRDMPWWRRRWRGGAVLIGLALIFTASRSGWLGAIVALGAGWWMVRTRARVRDGDHQQRIRQGRAVVAGLAAALVLLIAASAYATWRDVRHAEQRSYLDTALYTLNMRVPIDERLKGRLRFWRAAVAMIEERPLAGVGIGRYYKLVPKYLEDAGDDVIQENAHNYLLQLAADLGLPGLVCFIVLLASAIGVGWRITRDGEDERARTIASGLTSGMLALATTCLAAHVLLLREGQLTFWPLAALTFVLGRQATTLGGSVAQAPVDSRPALPPRALDAVAPALARWRPAVLAVAVGLLVASVPIRIAQDFRQLDLSRMPQGLYEEVEGPGGARFRWTEASATIFVPADAATLTLPIRTIAPMSQAVSILHDGRLVDKIVLADHEWHEPRYLLTRIKNGQRFHRFDIRVSPTWHPPDDPREMGVMLGSYRWSR